jgi:glutamine amidotransferase
MTSVTCAVIDYGIGNVFSVLHALKRIGTRAELTSEPEHILNADRVILPGVGAFGRAAEKLRLMGLEPVIHEYIASGKPFLGICVGMQLLMERSEEFGLHNGLGVIAGTVRKIETRDDDGTPCRVPLIGWIPVQESNDTAWAGTPFEATRYDSAFYFVHSFHCDVTDPAHRIGQHRLGSAKFSSAVRKDNVLGVQFHPERSASTGQRFLHHFISNQVR